MEFAGEYARAMHWYFTRGVQVSMQKDNWVFTLDVQVSIQVQLEPDSGHTSIQGQYAGS